MHPSRSTLVALSVAGLLVASAAMANTDIPTHFDARHAGMGSTGTAFADTPAAAYYNPAALEGIQRFSATAAFAPFAPTMKVPFAGAQITSERNIFPLFFAGAAYRLPFLADRLVAGLAVYPTAGMGGTYKNLTALGGDEMRASILAIEAALPISVRLTNGLAIAVAPRFTYVSQTAHAPQVQPTGMVMADQDLSGSSLAGMSAGVFYQPLRTLRLGFTYRSKVPVDITGSTTMAGTSIDTASQYVVPHSFRAGAALALRDDQVLLAFDLRYSLYADSNKTSTVTLTTPLGSNSVTSQTNWSNSLTACLGAEYVIKKLIPIRLGYTLTNSATPKDTANAFTPPPGLLHSVHVGAGVKLPHWNVDLAVYHTFGGSSDVAGSPNNMGPGTYEIDSYLAVLSANHHF